MERGLRVLIDPVDDAIENKNIIEEVLKPYEYVKKKNIFQAKNYM